MSAWLAACTVYDLRTRQVPNRLTMLPMALAALWCLIRGDWLLPLFLAALLLVSLLPQARARIPAGVAALVLWMLTGPSPQQLLAMLALLAVWVQWELDLTGGADAKILFTLLLVTGDGLLLVAVALAGGVQGLAGLALKRKTIPYTLAICAGTLLWLAASIQP